MRTAFGFLLAALSLVSLESSAVGPRTESDDRYRIQLSIQGVAIEGSQERALRLVGKGHAEQQQILNEPLPLIRPGAEFQLVVRVTDPSGVVKDYSRSSRIKYEGFGCLTISASGMASVRPAAGSLCVAPVHPMLWIVLTDSNNSPIAHNEYLFEAR